MDYLNRHGLIGRRDISLTDRAAWMIATGAGAGFAPIAPGTFGSMEGVAIYLAIKALHIPPEGHLILVLTSGLLLFIVGIWASSRACQLSGLKDPGEIVIDEVSGQLISLAPLTLVSLTLAPSVIGIVSAFLLFRLFDIFKPYPIYKLEHLPSGLGVMADDGLAGIYTAAIVWVALYLHLL